MAYCDVCGKRAYAGTSIIGCIGETDPDAIILHKGRCDQQHAPRLAYYESLTRALDQLRDNVLTDTIRQNDYSGFNWDTDRLTPRQRFLILRRDRFRCQLCGHNAGDGAKLVVDHRTPKSKGGDHGPQNLWTLCFECNSGKSDLPLYED